MAPRMVVAVGLRAGLALWLGLAASDAYAWGPDGHALIGKIADQLLAGTNAGQKIKTTLGTYTLEDAAKWPDCVRSVQKLSSGEFKFKQDQFTASCTKFFPPPEEQRMEDYASRNWDTFPNKGKPDHAAYHFADIPVGHGIYTATDIGANTHDAVHAINAAIAKLQGQPVPAPFNIRDEKEAILLLAHFVGDVHQPLHVGAIYLDAAGHEVDPRSEDEAEAGLTAGGNFIQVGTSTNDMHHEWDGIPDALRQTDIAVLVGEAKAVPGSNLPMSDWATRWASESVFVAREAYGGMTFAGAGPQKWHATFSNRAAYLDNQHKAQRMRVVQASARLAALFKAIWP